MPTASRARLALAMGSLCLSIASPAVAQSETTPPEVLSGGDPIAPDGALAPGESAAVVLILVVARDGSVSEVTIAEGANEALDRTALEAARALVFRPATRDGEPIAARIRYQFRFQGPPLPVEVEEEVEEEIAIEEEVDEASEEESEEESEAPDEDAEPELGIDADVDRPRRESTRRTLPRESLVGMPGTRDDALRVIELLPGVGRPPAFAGSFIVRGAGPADTEVFVDGVSVPLLYHFGGLNSFFPSRLLERVDFFPGNFSVRYGRRIGGIVEVEPRDPARDDFHGTIDVNSLDGSIILEAPLGDRAGIALAARRSYVDFFFAEMVPDDLFDVVAAPVYYDYQLIFSWRPTDQDRVRALIYGSSDEFRTVLSGDDFSQPFDIGIATQFHRGSVSWRHVEDDFRQEITIAGGWTRLEYDFDEFLTFVGDFFPITLRADWEVRLHDRVRVRAGLDGQYTPVSLSYRGPTGTQMEGDPSAMDGYRGDAASDHVGGFANQAVYLESSLSPEEWLSFVIGVRVDWYEELRRPSFDPRASFRLRVHPGWTIKGGLGLFSQAPDSRESGPGFGNPALDPMTAIHSGLGVEYQHDRTWHFEIEGFYKHVFDRVVGTADGRPPFYTNEGDGRIYGGELSIRAVPTPGFPIHGMLSYTLSRSERSERGGDYRLFDYDQTHILSFALVWNIGDGWQAGAAFRLVSGNPYTPVVDAIYDAGRDNYRPVYGAVNSERHPFFHRLDLRIEKVFQIDIVRLAIYLDIQNVYNAENREATAYSFDYRDSANVNGLPILPSLGIRGSL